MARARSGPIMAGPANKDTTVKRLYHVSVSPGIEYDCLGDEELKLKRDDEVIVRCERYKDCGVVTACDLDPAQVEENARKAAGRGTRGRKIEGRKTPEIIRRATLTDKGKAHENEVLAHSMQKTAMRKAREHGLDMKVLNSHMSFDNRLAVFQFSAEGRVDFRELLRDLSGALHTRVELRQVGVRDEAAIQGGLGPCGRVFCCTTFLRQFVSINVKMAKAQGLSLNPTNISGACGRLKCCLKFEDETYRELSRGMPRVGSFVDTPEGEGRVQDWNPLAQTVRVWLPDGADNGGKVAEFEVSQVSEKARCESRRSSSCPARERQSEDDEGSPRDEESRSTGTGQGSSGGRGRQGRQDGRSGDDRSSQRRRSGRRAPDGGGSGRRDSDRRPSGSNSSGPKPTGDSSSDSGNP